MNYGLSFPRYGETLDENGLLPFCEDALFIKSSDAPEGGVCTKFETTKDVEEIEEDCLVENANEAFTLFYKVATTPEELDINDGYFVGGRPIRRPQTA